MAINGTSCLAASRPRTPQTPEFIEQRSTALSTETALAASSLLSIETLRVAELEHRHSNMMMVTLSIVRNAMREAGGVEEGVAMVERRLLSLDAANRFISRFPDGQAPLSEICVKALTPFRDPGALLSLEGDNLNVPKDLVVALSLALHELATNAAKYGSLSVPSGKVLLSWDVAQSRQEVRLSMRWRERNGPPTCSPARRGFGSRMIDQVLRGHLASPIERVWGPDGLDCLIRLRFNQSGSVTELCR